MIEIGNNTMRSVVRLITSGSEMDSQLAEELKEKIEEVTEYRVEVVISAVLPTIPPTQSPSSYPPITYECNADGYNLYLSQYPSKLNTTDDDDYFE